MKHRLRCSFCGDEITVDLKREFKQIHCHCGQYIDMLKVKKGRVIAKSQLRNRDLPKRRMGNRRVILQGPKRLSQLNREKALVVASFPAWDEKLKQIAHPDARSWLASLLWWQIYCEIEEVSVISREAWRPYLLNGAGDITVEEFLQEIGVVGLDERVLTMQCRGCVSFPEHLRP